MTTAGAPSRAELPPHDLAAEEALLGDVLVLPHALAQVADVVAADDFYSPGHGHIYAALVELRGEDGAAVDALVLADRLRQRGQLDAVGGPEHLTALSARTSGAFTRHAHTIADHAHRRRLIASALQIAETARTGADPRPALDGLTALADAKVDKRAGVVRLSDVAPERVNWLWPGRLPLGKLVMLDGDPSVGKSTLSVDIAARLTTGSPMPDGSRLASPADVVLMSAEDGAADTIRPRLDAAGGDPSRVHLFVEVADTAPDGSPRRRPPSLPVDVARLERLVVDTGAKLVIVDVLAAYLGGADSHKDTDVRRVLHPLAAMAARTGCVVICLRHLSKSGGANPIYRGGGSIAFIGAARVGLLAAADPEDDSRRVLAVSKSNLAAIPDALAYRLVDSPEHGCARVQWEGATAHRAADLLLVRDEEQSDAHDAAAVLAEILADGPLWVKQARDAMAEAGFNKDQARRAKERLRVRSIKVGRPGDPDSGWKWELPEGGKREGEGGEGGSTPNPAPFASFVPPSEPEDDAA